MDPDIDIYLLVFEAILPSFAHHQAKNNHPTHVEFPVPCHQAVVDFAPWYGHHEPSFISFPTKGQSSTAALYQCFCVIPEVSYIPGC